MGDWIGIIYWGTHYHHHNPDPDTYYHVPCHFNAWSSDAHFYNPYLYHFNA